VALKFYRPGFEQARRLIGERQCVLDQPTDWTDHRPSRSAENRFVSEHGLFAFGRWHLAEEDEWEEDDKRHFKFPYGDLVKLHRCALVAARSRAAHYEYSEIEQAAAHLLAMLDDLMVAKAS
jgi:hypothetical protein